MLSIFLYALSFYALPVYAATAAQWRSRSIYQLFTDRYALPSGSKTTHCDPGAQTWCGGTWTAILENLDYIQNAGFTAVWISPVNKNYNGPRTAYGDPYTGYWVTDVSQLNSHFGTPADLKALSAELHRRDMFLMVDMVLNNVMAISTTPDYSSYFFKDTRQYHSYCPIQWGNRTSEMNYWLGDDVVPLPDINTENPSVSQVYKEWIANFTQEYSIDGFRIDAAKHAPPGFWAPICAAAGVFCMGEVFGSDINEAASYQGSGALDSVLNYPLYDALVNAFGLPGPQNMTGLVQVMSQSKRQYKDLSVLGNFLENQDVPRWNNISVDIQTMLNAMVFTFMTDGIPIVYYGQEQRFSGNADPWNREALWQSKYANTTVYSFISTLNKVRTFLANQTGSIWTTAPAQLVAATKNEIAVMKGNVISIMTNIGSPPQNTSVAVFTPWQPSTPTLDVLSCTQWAVGSRGTVSVEYSRGGRPVILIPLSSMPNSGLCGYDATAGNGLGTENSAAVRLSLGILSLALFIILYGLVYI